MTVRARSGKNSGPRKLRSTASSRANPKITISAITNMRMSSRKAPDTTPHESVNLSQLKNCFCTRGHVSLVSTTSRMMPNAAIVKPNAMTGAYLPLLSLCQLLFSLLGDPVLSDPAPGDLAPLSLKLDGGVISDISSAPQLRNCEACPVA